MFYIWNSILILFSVFSSLVNGSTSEYQRDESDAANQLIDTVSLKCSLLKIDGRPSNLRPPIDYPGIFSYFKVYSKRFDRASFSIN